MDSSSAMKGYYQYLPVIYSNEVVGSALQDTVSCLGMAGLAHFWNAPSIMVHANIKYNKAMQTVSSKLRDIEEAKSDQVMAAILMLAFYEVRIDHL